MKQPRAPLRHFLLLLPVLALAGCASIARVPFTKEQQSVATVPGIPNARVWSDDRADTLLARARSEVLAGPAGGAGPVNGRAFPGGVPTGASGGALLPGWPGRGPRPEFA